jgi:hypothetical protein
LTVHIRDNGIFEVPDIEARGSRADYSIPLRIFSHVSLWSIFMSQQGGIEFRVDFFGRWYGPDGSRLTEAALYFLTQNLRFDDSGYFIAMSFGPAKVIVEDVPFVITGLARDADDEHSLVLTLMDGTIERLAPETLSIKGEHFYCMVRNGRIPARFLPEVKEELERYVSRKGEDIYLTI